MSTDDDYRDMKPQGEWVEYVGISDTTNNTGLVPIIQAFCPEILPSFMGPPSPVPAAVPVATVNPLTGVETKSTLRQTTLLTCEYLGGDNHLVPCIYKGERVRIFNYGGSDKFYWLPLGREPGMRRHEHLRWFAMSQPKGVEKGVRFATTDLNSYFVDINTNEGQKCIHIHTSQADGEVHGYDIRICPQGSFIEINDTDGNFFILDSKIPMWHMHNTYDSNIMMTKDIININCHNILNIVADNAINVKTTALAYTTETTVHNASKSHTLTTDVNTISANKTMTVTTPDLTENADVAKKVGNYLFSGKKFVVASEHGMVPVIIVFGSNSW